MGGLAVLRAARTPDAPRALVDVIRRGLAVDPHDRGSAAAFALDLRHACRPEPVRLPVKRCVAEGVKFHDLDADGTKDAGEGNLVTVASGAQPRIEALLSAAHGERGGVAEAIRQWSKIRP